MSRQIRNDHRWNDEEVAYQEARNRHQAISQNREQFPDEKPAEKPTPSLNLSQEVFEAVRAMSGEDVRKTLAQRGLPTEGEDKDVKSRLALDLQREKDAQG
jgi:hypothetical protein